MGPDEPTISVDVSATEVERRKKKTYAAALKLLKHRSRLDNLPAKTGRNEPCPCGSGRKFKKCCNSGAREGTNDR